MPYIYTSYTMSHYSAKFLAGAITKWGMENVSEKFTVAFSNTPGPIKPFIYDCDKTIMTNSLVSYVMVPGRLGLNISCMSMVNSFRIGICSDSGYFDDNARLVKLIEDNIESQISKNNIKLTPASPASTEITPKENTTKSKLD